MMSNEKDMRANVASYLVRHGWQAEQDGVAGQLWALRDTQALGFMDRAEPLILAVPWYIEVDSFEYVSVVSRIARQKQMPVSELSAAVEREFLDGQDYRIADRYLVEQTAMLDGAATVLDSARRLMRAAATTARKPRARIGTGFSNPGDELARRARLSHTRHGSFILPVVMPVPPAEEEPGMTSIKIEPGERGVTRTLATALAALDTVAVRPDRSPRPDDIRDLVQSGVSKELVAAVRSIAVSAGVQAFDATFTWSPGLGEPTNAPRRVVIQDEAAPVLGQVVRQLDQLRAEPDASVTGQIVRIHYVQGDPYGEVAIRTERRNRVVDISVTVDEKTIHKAYEWARDHRAVIARGKIERQPGRPLFVQKPESIGLIDQLFNDTLL